MEFVWLFKSFVLELEFIVSKSKFTLFGSMYGNPMKPIKYIREDKFILGRKKTLLLKICAMQWNNVCLII
jgi:hypothetical protein